MPRPPKQTTPSNELAKQDGVIAFAVGAGFASLCWLAASRGFGAGLLMGIGDWIAAKASRFLPHAARLTDREAMTWGATGIAVVVAAVVWAYLQVTFRTRLESREADRIIAAEKKAQRLREVVAQRSQSKVQPTDSSNDRLRTERDEFIRRTKGES